MNSASEAMAAWDADAFRRAGEAIDEELATAFEAAALLVEGAAKKLAPVRTGRLRASITHRLQREALDIYAEVGTNVEYATYVEEGTTRNKPHPFLAPALDANRNAITDLITNAIRKAAGDD